MNKKEVDPWGARLKAVLKDKNLSQVDVADALGVSEMSVSKWARGGGISVTHLGRLCDYLCITPEWLVYGRGVYSDVIWLEDEGTCDDDPSFVKKTISLAESLNCSLQAELALGYVCWVHDIQKREWLWRDNARRFFGISEDGPIRTLMHAAMSESDAALGATIIADLAEGRRKTGWMRYTLTTKPGECFLMVAKRITDHQIIGITISGEGVLAQAIGPWWNDNSESDA